MEKGEGIYLVSLFVLILMSVFAYFYLSDDGLEVGLSPTAVNLVWTDNAGNENGFTVQRDVVNTFTNPVIACQTGPVSGVGAQGTCSHPLTDLVSGVAYYYRVRAENAIGQSGWSSTAAPLTWFGQCDSGPPAQMQSCSSPSNPLQGACVAGTQTCQSDGSWGSCVGEILSSLENTAVTCSDSIDNDCDGLTDCADSNCAGLASCLCTPGTSTACYTGAVGTAGVGICQSGAQTCNAQGNGYGACIGQVLPGTETCNNLDDDCDGFRDENPTNPNNPLTQSCYNGPVGTSGIGVCHVGLQTCAVGVWSSCVGEVLPSPEICIGGADEDCDNTADCLDNSCAVDPVCMAPATPGSLNVVVA